jgi:hypothetical protein
MEWDSIFVGYDNNGASYERAMFLGYNLASCLFCCVYGCNNIVVGARCWEAKHQFAYFYIWRKECVMFVLCFILIH